MVEYRGEAIETLSMEERMTVCNMSIEGGARAGMIAPDRKTFDYVRGRRYAPKDGDYETALESWKDLSTDPDAEFDKSVSLDAEKIAPQVSWGTNPGMVTEVTSRVPDPGECEDEGRRKSMEQALEYMGLSPNTPITDISVDRVFIGSCTNSRAERKKLAGLAEREDHLPNQLSGTWNSLIPKRRGSAFSENNYCGKIRPRSKIALPATECHPAATPPGGTGKSIIGRVFRTQKPSTQTETEAA